jgi:hypothetical protein
MRIIQGILIKVGINMFLNLNIYTLRVGHYGIDFQMHLILKPAYGRNNYFLFGKKTRRASA